MTQLDIETALKNQSYPFSIDEPLQEWVASYKYANITSNLTQLSKSLTLDQDNLASLVVDVRRWLNNWVFDANKQPIKRPDNILESRLITAEDAYDSHMSSCGSMSTLGATILRAAGVPVKLVDGSHPKSTDHAWVEVYFPDSKLWIAFDFTGYGDPETGLINETYEKLAECHDWSEIEPALTAKYERWVRHKASLSQTT